MLKPGTEHSFVIKCSFVAIVFLFFFPSGYVPSGFGKADVVSEYLEKLKDPDARIRRVAARALGNFKDNRAIEPLIAAFKDAELEVREHAEEALVNIGAPAVEPLIEAFKYGEKRVHLYAAGALGKIKDPGAVEPLIAIFRDTTFKMQPNAAIVSGNPLLDGLENDEMRADAARVLGEINDTRAVEPLIAALKDSNPFLVKEEAVIALGKIKDPRAVEPLIAILKSGRLGPFLPKRAARALTDIGAPAVDSLIATLKDENAGVRMDAADALGEIRDPRAVGPLIDAMSDTDPYARSSVVSALGKLGMLGIPRASDVLEAALDKRDLFVIASACEFFIHRGWPGSEDILVQSLNSHGGKHMAEAFLNCGNPALEKAAREWATKHGAVVITKYKDAPSKNVRWGK